MTIPQSFEFSPPEDLEKENLYRNLNEMYEKVSTGLNGSNKSSFMPAPFIYTPTIKGSGTAGTFSYSVQNAVVFRMGRLVDLWYEIIWSNAGTAAGNIELTLPYKASLFTGSPFVGPSFTSGIDIGAFGGVFLVPTSNSFDGLFWKNTLAGGAKAELAVAASGSIQGCLRYMTQEEGGV